MTNPITPFRPYPYIEILKQAFRSYFSKGSLQMIRALLPPFLLQLFGIYLAILPSYYLMDWAKANPALMQHPLLMVAACLLPSFIGIYCFCLGFWHWLLYMVSLYQNAWELINGEPLHIKEAFEHIRQNSGLYVRFLLAVVGIQLLLVGILLGPAYMFKVADLLPPPLGPVFCLLDFLVFLVTIPLFFLFCWIMDIAYPILSFEQTDKASITVKALFKRTWHLFRKNWVKFIGLRITLIILNLILSNMFMFVMSVTGVATLFALAHQGIPQLLHENLAPYVPALSDPKLLAAFQKIHFDQVLAGLLLGGFLGVALTPFVILAKTALYSDMRAREDASAAL